MGFFQELIAARRRRKFRKFRDKLLFAYLQTPNANKDDVRNFFLEVSRAFEDCERGHKDLNVTSLLSLWSGSSQGSKI